MKDFKIRPLEQGDAGWVSQFLTQHWGSPVIVTRGKIFRADELPGFVAVQADQKVGLVTYRIDKRECEIGSINSLVEGLGIGSDLVEAVKNTALAEQCSRLWAITTNDNTPAIRFWQRRGFTIAAVYPNAIEKSRLLKPEIPLTGSDGIPIRDEIEFEISL